MGAVLVVERVHRAHRVAGEDPHRRLAEAQAHEPHRRRPSVEVQRREHHRARACLPFLGKRVQVERLPVEHEAQPPRQPRSFCRLPGRRQVVEPQVVGGKGEMALARLAKKPTHGGRGARAVEVLGWLAQAVVEGKRFRSEREQRPGGEARVHQGRAGFLDRAHERR